MGLKKGETREWDTWKNKTTENKNIKLSIRITQETKDRLDKLKKEKKYKFVEVLLAGLEKLEEK